MCVRPGAVQREVLLDLGRLLRIFFSFDLICGRRCHGELVEVLQLRLAVIFVCVVPPAIPGPALSKTLCDRDRRYCRIHKQPECPGRRVWGAPTLEDAVEMSASLENRLPRPSTLGAALQAPGSENACRARAP